MAGKIAVVGSSNTDMIMQMDHIPVPGETIIGGAFSMAAGGKGANQAVAAARAGGQVTFIARVGRDMFGDKAVEGFQADGIEVKYVLRDEQAASGVALIFVAADGENSIGVASGANGRLSAEDVRNAREAITAADVLIMQLETPLETVTEAANIAAQAGVQVILDPAPAQPLGDELLKNISILTPNESEAELLTGIKVDDQAGAEKAADALLARGVDTILITLGARGTLLADKKGKQMVEAFKVKAVDTTAAGDVFNGSLAVALAQGKSLPEAIRWANAAAALSVTKLGAQPSAPKRTEIEDFLAKQ